MAESYQWMPKCDFCKTYVTHHCNTCGDALCDRCKLNHQRSTGSHHQIVPYAEKVELPSETYMVCKDHNGDIFRYWCEPCQEPTCGLCVLSSHSGHRQLDIVSAVQNKRAEINASLKELHETRLEKGHSLLSNAEEMSIEYTVDINDVSKSLERQANNLHKAVDKILDERKRELQNIKTNGIYFLRLQERELMDEILNVQKIMKQIVHIRDKAGFGFMHFDTNLIPHLTIAVPQRRAPPKFKDTIVDENALRSLFGSLEYTHYDNNEERMDSDIKQHDIPEQPLTTIVSPEIISTFNTNFTFPNIACRGDGTAWIRTNYMTLQLVGKQGTVMDTINTDFDFNDLACTKQGDFLLTDRKNYLKTSSQRKNEMKSLLKTHYSDPFGLFSMQNGDILVTFHSLHMVVQYDSNGLVMHEFDKKRIYYPRRVAENMVNKDVYICNWRALPCKGGSVVAFDAIHRYRFTYTGQDPGCFDPYDVCCDSIGHLLIADREYSKIHLLDRDGQFLRYLLTGHQRLSRPMFIDIDNDDNAWIGEHGGQVKIVRYIYVHHNEKSENCR